MPTALINGVKLYYEEHGEGTPLVFSHEFAGSHESWDAQVAYFSRHYRVITWNYRGYPPSDVPDDPAAYSEEQLVHDLRALLDHLGIERAHIAGLSMGGSIALKFGIRHPERCLGVVVAGAGSGTVDKEQFQRDGAATIARFAQGIAAAAAVYTRGPARLQLERKDPLGYERFKELFLQHSAHGSALMMRGVQLARQTIYEAEDEIVTMQPPTLIMVGDEDEPCVEPALFMKRRIPNSGLVMFPKSGHCINLEEPALFNQTLMEFLVSVEHGRWQPRGEISHSLLPADARA